MTDLLYAELTYYLRGAAFKVHNELGCGLAESAYETALAYLFAADQVPFLRQPIYYVYYDGRQVGEYRPDFMLADGGLSIDLKSAPTILPLHKAQVLSYLAVTGAALGLVMNFGASSMQIARLPNFLAERRAPSHTPTIPQGLLKTETGRRLVNVLSKVHHTLGPGFLHQVYRRATWIELGNAGLRFDYIKELPISIHSLPIGPQSTRIFFIEGQILLATVALSEVTPAHRQRLRWAMRALNCERGLIANFYPPTLEHHFLRAENVVADADTLDHETN